MGNVLAMHGVAPNVDRRRLAFQFVARLEAFEQVLATATRFVPLSEALAGDGTALSIDDATHGSAAAARLALTHGHAVSLFVNPEQVASGAPYALAALSVLLDRLGAASVELDGARVPAATVGERIALRKRIKKRLVELRSEPARLSAVMELAATWGLGPIDMPGHLRTLTTNDLVMLRDAGVDVQNHGWSHANHDHLSGAESAREVRDGRQWLQRELSLEAPVFAVPFGSALPAPEALRECSFWLTSDTDRPGGMLAPQVFNRDTPAFAGEQAGKADRNQPAPSVSGWTWRLRRLLLR